MHCNQFQEKIEDIFYTESLEEAPDLKAHLKAHLKECSSCNQVFKELTLIRTFFSQLPELHPSSLSTQKILTRARLAQEKKSFSLMRWWKLDFKWAFAPAAVMGLMLVAVIVSLLSPSSQTDLVATAEDISSAAIWDNQTEIQERTPSSLDYANNRFHLRGVLSEEPSPLPLAPGLRSVAIDSLKEPDVTAPQSELSIGELKDRWEERQTAILESDADALMMRGRRFKAMGRVDLALNDFETIYRFYPDYTYMGDVLMYRAQCFAFQGKYDKAIESLNIFAKKYPSKEALVQPMISQLTAQAAKATE